MSFIDLNETSKHQPSPSSWHYGCEANANFDVHNKTLTIKQDKTLGAMVPPCVIINVENQTQRHHGLCLPDG